MVHFLKTSLSLNLNLVYFLYCVGISKINGNAVFAQQTKLFWETWRAPEHKQWNKIILNINNLFQID